MAGVPKVTLVRPRHVAWGALWMGLLVTGGAVQTHLRFCERDVEIQTRHAQEELASLMDQRAALEAKVEAMRSGERVKERAMTELGLVPAPPTEVHRLDIDDAMWAKYAAPDEPADAGDTRREGEPAWMEWIGDRISLAESPGGQ